MMRRALMLSVLLVAPVSPAFGQSGVVVDPSSPTGKEYAIPLESARGIGSDEPKKTAQPQYERSAPLFGEGVGDDRAAAPLDTAETNAERGRTRGRGPRSTHQSRSQPRTASSPPLAEKEVPLRPLAADTGTDVLPLGGGALLVLIAAGAGVVLRQTRR